MNHSIGVLVIHGFTAHISCVEVIPEVLCKHGILCDSPILPGHSCETPDSLFGVTWHDWLAHCQQAMLALLEKCDKVILVGHSMGALLAINLQNEYPDKVDSLVLAAPALYLTNPLAPTKPLNFAAHILAKVAKTWTLKHNSEGTELSTHQNYRWVPTAAIKTFFELIKVTFKKVPFISAPTLIIQSKKDRVVATKSGEYIFEKASMADKDKRMVYFYDSEHELFRDSQRYEISHEILRFVQGRQAQT